MFRKIFIFQRVLFISLFFIFSFQSIFANLTHIWPESGLNENVVSVHTFGSGFSGTTIVKLIRTGSLDINGININVVSDSYLTCDFNLVGSDSGLYTLIVETDTLKSCFTVNTKVDTPYICKKLDIGSGENYMDGVTVGDGNNDGVLEIYGANMDHHIYQFKWDGSSWNKTDIGSSEGWMLGVAVGDGDNDGILEVYGANMDHHIYQLKWDGSSWNKTDIGSGGDWMYGVAIGDGNNDGVLEIYGANRNHHIYQFKAMYTINITHIWPESGLNENIVSVHAFGLGFSSSLIVKLIRTGSSDINGINVNVVSGNYLICDFNLLGLDSGVYSLIIGTDTLKSCFTVNTKVDTPYIWQKADIGSGEGRMYGITVGDGDNDGVLEIYGANADHHIYQFKWDGSSWNKTDIGSGGDWMLGIAVGNGDNDGVLDVYGANWDHHIYQFKWDGSSWNKTDIGSGGDYMNGVTIGDGDNDGILEIYCTNADHHIYQFKWDGSSWSKTDIGSGENWMYRVTVGDADNDEALEIYCTNRDHHIYQFKWDGSSWNKTDIGSGGDWMYGVAIGDADNDEVLEVYGANGDHHIYQFKWDGSSWNKTDIGLGEDWMLGITVGDGDNDGVLEIYGANADHHIYRFKWDGSSWNKIDIGSGGDYMNGLAIGDGDNDGYIEVYGANYDHYIYQFGDFFSCVEEKNSKDRFIFKIKSISIRGETQFGINILEDGKVNLSIYDVTGKLVSELIKGKYTKGLYKVMFKPKCRGLYFYRLEAGHTNRAGKIIIF